MCEQLDEFELVRRLSLGDRESFTTLYNRNINNLHKYIFLICKSQELAEEIVQCVFIKIWERRELLEHTTSFKAYLYRSAKNQLLDYFKRRKIMANALVTIQPVSEQSDVQTDTNINFRDFYLVAQKAIDLLPEKRRQIVELRTKEELSLDEIAVKLAISKSVVKKQLYSGMDFVRKYIQNHGEFMLGIILLDSLIHIFYS